MSNTGRRLRENNEELIKYIGQLKEQRSELCFLVEKQQLEKSKLETEIGRINYKLGLITKSLAQRIDALEKYDVTIREIDKKYQGLADNATVLLNSVRLESDTLGNTLDKKTGTDSDNLPKGITHIIKCSGCTPKNEDKECYRSNSPNAFFDKYSTNAKQGSPLDRSSISRQNPMQQQSSGARQYETRQPFAKTRQYDQRAPIQRSADASRQYDQSLRTQPSVDTRQYDQRIPTQPSTDTSRQYDQRLPKKPSADAKQYVQRLPAQPSANSRQYAQRASAQPIVEARQYETQPAENTPSPRTKPYETDIAIQPIEDARPLAAKQAMDPFSESNQNANSSIATPPSQFSTNNPSQTPTDTKLYETEDPTHLSLNFKPLETMASIPPTDSKQFQEKFVLQMSADLLSERIDVQEMRRGSVNPPVMSTDLISEMGGTSQNNSQSQSIGSKPTSTPSSSPKASQTSEPYPSAPHSLNDEHPTMDMADIGLETEPEVEIEVESFMEDESTTQMMKEKDIATMERMGDISFNAKKSVQIFKQAYQLGHQQPVEAAVEDENIRIAIDSLPTTATSEVMPYNPELDYWKTKMKDAPVQNKSVTQHNKH